MVSSVLTPHDIALLPLYINRMQGNFSRIRRVFGQKSRSATVTAPAGRRIYAIGDIHGRADLLHQMHQMIARDVESRGWANNQLVYLGDYIDRGSQSREVLALVMGVNPPGFDKVCLRGNHEAMLLDFLENPANCGAWLRSGGNAALGSFGAPVLSEFARPEQKTFAASQLSKALQPQELDFLKNLKFFHREGGYYFCHAGVRPGASLEAQKEEDMIWIRTGFLEHSEDFGAVIVHGHSISAQVELRPNRIGIDTGAYASGKLTCLVLEGNKRWLLQTGQPQRTAVQLPV